MAKYILKRIAYMALTLVIVTSIYVCSILVSDILLMLLISVVLDSKRIGTMIFAMTVAG